MRQIREIKISNTSSTEEAKEAINKTLSHAIPLDSPLWVCIKKGELTTIRIDVDAKDEDPTK